MKKLLLLFGFLAVAKAGCAQNIAAGTVSLTGNIGYNRTINTSTIGNTYGYNGSNVIMLAGYTAKTTNSQLNTDVSSGYFVADNLAVGLRVGFNTSSSTQKITANSTAGIAPTALPDLKPSILVQAGVFVQYYKLFIEQFGVVGTLGGGYQQSKSYGYSAGTAPVATNFTGKGYYAALTPGIVFFPIPKLGISASIGSLSFSHFSNDLPDSPGTAPVDGYENSSSTFGTSFGFDHLAFGGTYYFGR